ncbi:MAG: hypothetical protein IPG07_10860 [Crocinitomicaceae bacterium]|jgi:hypothetical protein|nr:hypothetical protein [Crocinitomicaceae bacterium]
MTQLKLPLFADEVVESEISICFSVKFAGMRRAHQIVSIERDPLNTIIIIWGINYHGKKTKILQRCLAVPGIFNLPFDILMPGLAELPQKQLMDFSKQKIFIQQ